MLLDIDTEKIATEATDLTFQELSASAKSSSHFNEIRARVINQLIIILHEHPDEFENLITSTITNLIADKAKNEYAPLIRLINLSVKIERQE